MTFFPTENRLGLPPIAYTASTQAVALGTIVRAQDATLGGGEFIYLKGVANTLVGSLVTYDPVNATTTLAPNTANLAQPVAVSMSANVANQYGWYQVEGVASIKKTAVKVNPNVAIFLSATAGRVMPTAASGKEILSARSVNSATVASTTSTVNVLLNRPFAQGQTI